jgi:NAD(P)-dependent dehydrogenase (short-subunit alcohol dehydrogenase family)
MSDAIRTDLGGKVALVTGGSRGLGAAVATTLAEAGADVVLTYRKQEEEAVVVAEQVRDAGRRAWARPLELAEAESIDGFFDWVTEEVGTLDVVVANAASTKFVGLLEAERRHVERTFAISVTGSRVPTPAPTSRPTACWRRRRRRWRRW